MMSRQPRDLWLATPRIGMEDPRGL